MAISVIVNLTPVTVMQERAEGTATPSDSNSDVQKEGAHRAPVQSPVGTSAAGEMAKSVFSSIISPVLTLFQEKHEEPSVVLQVGSETLPPFRCAWQRPMLKPLDPSMNLGALQPVCRMRL